MSRISPKNTFGKGLGLAHEVELALGKADVTKEMMQRLVVDTAFRVKIVDAFRETEAWIDQIMLIEMNCHKAFFGRSFSLNLFQETLANLGRDKIEYWKTLDLEVHYLPAVTLNQDDVLPGWYIKPVEWYWKQLAEGKLLLCDGGGNAIIQKTADLGGIVALVETQREPHYRNGLQIFENNSLLGPIIEDLRKDEKIAPYKHGLQSNRFGISPKEWENHIRAAYAKMIDVSIDNVSFEKAITANIIPQIYRYMPRSTEGETDTWVWYEEHCNDLNHRLCGGHTLYGGLANINCLPDNEHYTAGAIRPFVTLAS